MVAMASSWWPLKQERYRGNPDVELIPINNTLGKGMAQAQPNLATLPTAPKVTVPELRGKLDQALTSGQISAKIHSASQ